jgi:hypothetical protein
VVKSENARFLQFNHRHTSNQEVYLLVNDRKKAENYHISLRNTGIPSIWHPETGEIHPFDNYELSAGRLDLILDFKPRESFFLVLDSNKPDPAKGWVESTSLVNYHLLKNKDSL